MSLPASCDPPTEDNPPQQAVWVIFGATGHVGGSLVRAALSHGDKVVAVGQTAHDSLAAMKGWHERCLGLLCDVRMRESVIRVVEDAVAHWGSIDIIANCTGYGIIGAAEDQTPSDLTNQFRTNFLGTLHILQASLTYFRTHAIPGRYIIFSSTAGALGVPGLAPFCASKYAVEGLVESLLYEVHAFGIKATLVEPGHIRQDEPGATVPVAELQSVAPRGPGKRARKRKATGDAAPSETTTAVPPIPSPSTAVGPPASAFSFSHFNVLPTPSPPYSSPHAPAAHARRIVQWLNARQPSSAVRSAELVWQLGHCAFPPLRLLLGSYAVDNIRDRLKCIIEEIEDWKWLNFPVDGRPVGAEKGRGLEEGDGEEEGDGDRDRDGDADGEGDGEEQESVEGDEEQDEEDVKM